MYITKEVEINLGWEDVGEVLLENTKYAPKEVLYLISDLLDVLEQLEEVQLFSEWKNIKDRFGHDSLSSLVEFLKDAENSSYERKRITDALEGAGFRGVFK